MTAAFSNQNFTRSNQQISILPTAFKRPSHLQMPGGPKIARAALSRLAMCGNVAAKRGEACFLFGG